ncbi:hypothetical protein [Oceanospirillum beijerinckii]|nr:hypothetical protein [Oceanospirillum beijerinckii]
MTDRTNFVAHDIPVIINALEYRAQGLYTAFIYIACYMVPYVKI